MVSAWRKTSDSIPQVDIKQSDTESKKEKSTSEIGNRNNSSWAYWQKERTVKTSKGCKRPALGILEKVHSKLVFDEK